MSAETELTTLPSGIETALPEAERAADYDRIAPGYDLLVGSALYNRIVWGCPKSAYRQAAERFFDYCREGPVIDSGCGSLVFTADTYRGREERLTLFDRSLGMLERGQKRLPRGRFVQGDAFDPPFEPGSFAGAMSWGMLHLFGTGSAYLSRLRNLVRPGGIVAMGTLALADRPLGDRWLHALHKRCEAAVPQTRHRVIKGFANHFTHESTIDCGNMLFLFGHRRFD